MTKGFIRGFGSSLRRHWLAAMSGGFSVPFGGLAVFAGDAYARMIWEALAACAVFIALVRYAHDKHTEAAELAEKLRPKIKVVGIHEKSEAVNNGSALARVFEIEIQNESGESLNDCLAVVTDISASRLGGAGYSEIYDMSGLYKPHTGIALRTAASNAKEGGSPFKLRAGQKKKIRLCSKQDGIHGQLNIHYEPDHSYHVYGVPSFKEGSLEVTIYGAPSPTVERFDLSVNDNGELQVIRHVG